MELVQHHDALENRAEQGQLEASKTQHQSELTKADKQSIARQVPEQTVYRSIKQTSTRSQLCDLNAATPPASALQHVSRHGTDKRGGIRARGGDPPSYKCQGRWAVPVKWKSELKLDSVQNPVLTCPRPTDAVGRGLQGSFQASKAEKVMTGTNRGMTIPTRGQANLP